MAHDYVSIDSIFGKLVRDATDNFNEDDVIEWCGEALEQTGTVKSYVETVAFIEVKNHQCELPKGTHAIIQIARDSQWSKETALCPDIVAKLIQKDEAAIPVTFDCKGQPIHDYELAYYRPYYDFKAEYFDWTHSALYQQRFNPVRMSNNTFADAASIICIEKDQSIYKASRDEYTVISKQLLRFSFREGMVAVAFLKQKLDPVTGYPMIPDRVSHREAITRYIRYKILDRQCFNGREGACGKADREERQWHWYCKQSKNADLMPSGIDDHQDLLDQRSYLLPRQGRYFGFFGNLNAPERRTWNDPDRLQGTYFR